MADTASLGTSAKRWPAAGTVMAAMPCDCNRAATASARRCARFGDILNAVLFLLIGLEVVTISWNPRLIALGVAAISLVRLARGVAIVALLALPCPILSLGRFALVTLIRGEWHSGISIALTLGLPDGPARPIASAATYVVVLFAVIVQAGTTKHVLASARRDANPKAAQDSSP